MWTMTICQSHQTILMCTESMVDAVADVYVYINRINSICNNSFLGPLNMDTDTKADLLSQLCMKVQRIYHIDQVAILFLLAINFP